MFVHSFLLQTIPRCLSNDALRFPEAVRWAALAGAAAILLSGLTGAVLHGRGDAAWYGVMLADAIAQARAGVFPLWTGQSIYQFNGAVYPLRVAPAFHYLGVLLDFLTFHRLGVFAVLNLLLVLLGSAALACAYLCLGRLLPGRRWLAAGLAVLFFACPGVLGIAYQGDLYMTWTTLPWVPVVWYAIVQSYRNGGSLRTMLLLGGALGACFWGHSPIALWLTLLAGATQAGRLIIGRANRGAWIRAAGALAALLAVGAYPIGSVLLYPPVSKAYAFQLASAHNVAYFVDQAFPAVVRPLSALGLSLGDLQLGYSLWLVLLLGIAGAVRTRRREAIALLLCATVLAVLLTPIPKVNEALWAAVPAFIRNPTSNWPMNRLYLVMAGAVVFGAAAAARGNSPLRGRIALGLAVAIGCAWSLREDVTFLRGSRAMARSPGTAVDMLRPENVVLTRFSYFVFPQAPSTFTHSVADPALEWRLAADPEAPPFLENVKAAIPTAGKGRRLDFRVAADDPATLTLPPFDLMPGRHYLLAFDFKDLSRAKGTLRISGTSLFRDYGLPDWGGARSFGAGGIHSTIVPLSTSRPEGETVTVRFLPDPALGPPGKFPPFGGASLFAYDPARLPVRVASWIPLRAEVDSPAAAWLETPRMFVPGYRAWVDGRSAPVRPTREGLASVPVPSGHSAVELRYEAPIGLRALFWGSLAAAAAGLVFLLQAAGRGLSNGRLR